MVDPAAPSLDKNGNNSTHHKSLWAKDCRGFIKRQGADGAVTIRRAHAGRRSCSDEGCLKRYWKKVFSVALAGLEEVVGDGTGRRLRFLTLTLPALIRVPRCWLLSSSYHLLSCRIACTPSRHECELAEVTPLGPVAYRYTSWAFNRFIVSVRRRYGRMVYFRVVEEQPRRLAPHLHLLVASVAYMPQPELVTLAVRAGLGRIVDIRKVDSLKRGAGYLAKYATKTSGARVPRGYHFYTRSFTWALLARAARKARRDLRRAADDGMYSYVLEEDAFALVVELGLPLGPPSTTSSADALDSSPFAVPV